MEAGEAVDVLRHVLWVLVLVSAPVLLPLLVVGLIVGIVQAATSINETVISLIPKLLVTAVVLGLFGTFMIGRLSDLYVEMTEQIAAMGR